VCSLLVHLKIYINTSVILKINLKHALRAADNNNSQGDFTEPYFQIQATICINPSVEIILSKSSPNSPQSNMGIIVVKILFQTSVTKDAFNPFNILWYMAGTIP
jgi:hypothetical protein